MPAATPLPAFLPAAPLRATGGAPAPRCVARAPARAVAGGAYGGAPGGGAQADGVWERWAGVRDGLWGGAVGKRTYDRAAGSGAAEARAREGEVERQAWEGWMEGNREGWGAGEQWEDRKWRDFRANREDQKKVWGPAYAYDYNPEVRAAPTPRSAGAGSGSRGGWKAGAWKAGGGAGQRAAAEQGYGQQQQQGYGGGGGGGGGGGAAAAAAGVDLYAVLGCSKTASDSEIKNAYRAAARANHPDLNPGYGSTAKMQQVVTAYTALKDVHARSYYDAHGVLP